jgi:hypothetical protein
MVRRGEATKLDLDALPDELRTSLTAAMDGAEITLVSGDREMGQLLFRPSVLEGVVLPDARDAAPGVETPEGVTVVATAMKLSDAARRRLSDEFGSEYIVLDLHDAPPTTDVLLINPVSPQLLNILHGSFPTARLIITEIEDDELDVSYPGPVSRLLDAGASAYLPPRPVAEVASTVHAYLTQESAPALEAADRSGSQLPSAETS